MMAQLPLQRYEFSHPSMGTVFRLLFYTEKDSITAGEMAHQVFSKVDSLNASFSDYQPESEINQLCDAGGTPLPIPVSDDLWQILQLATDFSVASDGSFDVTVGAVTRLWRKARAMKSLPDSARLAAAVETVGFHKIQFLPNQKIRINHKGTRLDLGGIAQGYAADACLLLLRQSGIKIALVDAGGDIALGDAPPGEKGWQIEVPKGTMYLANCAITSSGASYRFLEIDGKRYSHIIDPRNGQALTHRNIVTVLAQNTVTADACATAVSVGGKKVARKLRRKYPGLKVWVSTQAL